MFNSHVKLPEGTSGVLWIVIYPDIYIPLMKYPINSHEIPPKPGHYENCYLNIKITRWWDATTSSGSVRSGAWNDGAVAGLASASGSGNPFSAKRSNGKWSWPEYFGASFEWWLATLVWFSRNMNATCIWTNEHRGTD